MYKMIGSRWEGKKYEFQPGATLDDKLEMLRSGVGQLTCDVLVIGTLFEDVSRAFAGIASILEIAPQTPMPLDDILVFTRMLQDLYAACGNEWTNLRDIAAAAAPGPSTADDVQARLQTLKEEMRREMRAMLPDLSNLPTQFAAAQQGNVNGLLQVLSAAARMTQEGGTISREEGDSMMDVMHNLDPHPFVPAELHTPLPTPTAPAEGGMGPRVPTAEEVLQTLSGVTSRLDGLDAEVKCLQQEVKHHTSGEFIDQYLERIGITSSSLQQFATFTTLLRVSSAPPMVTGDT